MQLCKRSSKVWGTRVDMPTRMGLLILSRSLKGQKAKITVFRLKWGCRDQRRNMRSTRPFKSVTQDHVKFKLTYLSAAQPLGPALECEDQLGTTIEGDTIKR